MTNIKFLRVHVLFFLHIVPEDCQHGVKKPNKFTNYLLAFTAYSSGTEFFGREVAKRNLEHTSPAYIFYNSRSAKLVFITNTMKKLAVLTMVCTFKNH